MRLALAIVLAGALISSAMADLLLTHVGGMEKSGGGGGGGQNPLPLVIP